MRKPLSGKYLLIVIFVAVNNVALVLKCATRFEMRPVIARCDKFISQNALILDQQKLFQVSFSYFAYVYGFR